MTEQENLLDNATIQAAVAGEKWATEKVIAHYDPYMDEFATVELRQADGSRKKIVDQDMKLLEALPNFPMEQA